MIAQEARVVMRRMATDSAVSQRILDLARQGDRARIATLLKADAPRSTIEVRAVHDFTIRIRIRMGLQAVTLCASNSGGCAT